MSETILVIGYGPVGAATTAALVARGTTVRVAQRTRPVGLPAGVAFTPCDVTDRGALRRAAEGAAQIVLSIGLTYSGKIWRELWPEIMTNVVETAAATGARVVFVDNLYMYGPQTAPLSEDMPLSDFGQKPAARSAATRIWQAASQAGRIEFAALRAPDFYGPGVTLSVLGDTGFAALAKGKPASWLGDADIPHDVAYVPDIARAAVTLLDAPDDAYGQPGTSPARRRDGRGSCWRWAPRRSGFRPACATCPSGRSARWGWSRRSCASSRKCALLGTDPIGSTPANSRAASGRTRRRSR